MGPLILFDGVCNLCNASVDFIIKRDKGYFKFASLQSEFVRQLLPNLLVGENPESIILYENGEVFTKSTAALKIASHLQFPWNNLKFFLFVPRPIRDSIYKFIAQNRYRWFGKRNTCRLPTPEERTRILG